MGCAACDAPCSCERRWVGQRMRDSAQCNNWHACISCMRHLVAHKHTKGCSGGHASVLSPMLLQVEFLCSLSSCVRERAIDGCSSTCLNVASGSLAQTSKQVENDLKTPNVMAFSQHSKCFGASQSGMGSHASNRRLTPAAGTGACRRGVWTCLSR